MTLTKVYSKALDQSIEIGRVIDSIKSRKPGPTLIFMGGVHGNEPSGIFALHNVFGELKNNNVSTYGNIYGISGNLWALERGERYEKEDLNRLWTKETFEELENGSYEPANCDQQQVLEIYNQITEILKNDSGPFYFFDLHTTSSETIPFLTVNDSLLNRKFTQQYPAPIILGIEEYLNGPLLSAINELGYVAFGYEGGQHDDLSSIENHMAFIYLSLVYTEVVDKHSIDFTHYYQLLNKTCIDSRDFYEIFYREVLNGEDSFKMNDGFINFQRIKRGQPLAQLNGKQVTSRWNARIFMPLYQSQGNDGFFVIRKIPGLFLRLSAVMRKKHFDQLIAFLPGVRWAEGRKDVLIVNTKIARVLSKQLFHLLGYRSKLIENDRYVMKNREFSSRNQEYENTRWY